MSLRNELQAIYEQQGFLTPQSVVDAAKPAKHPLHDRFEWNDKIAGPLYRLEQARELIRSVKVQYRKPHTVDEDSIRFFHSVKTEDGHVYKTVDDIKEDPFLSKVLLAEAERAWKELYSRYSHLAEFLDMVKADLETAV